MRRILPALAVAILLPSLVISPAHALKDKDAREQIEALEHRLNQIESSLQVRQMGLGEQIQSVREEIARLDSMIDENHRNTQLLASQLEVAKIEMQEALVQLNNDYGRRFQTVDENIDRLLKGIEGLQQNVRTLSDNIQAMSEFEQKQEERIGQLNAQLLQQIRVVVDEVSTENQRLRNEMAEMGRDIAAFQGLVNQVDGRVRGLEGELREVARRQASLARGTPGSSGEGHVVRQGETLSKIAAQYGVTVEALMTLNGLEDANLIREGQTLVIPSPP